MMSKKVYQFVHEKVTLTIQVIVALPKKQHISWSCRSTWSFLRYVRWYSRVKWRNIYILYRSCFESFWDHRTTISHNIKVHPRFENRSPDEARSSLSGIWGSKLLRHVNPDRIRICIALYKELRDSCGWVWEFLLGLLHKSWTSSWFSKNTLCDRW